MKVLVNALSAQLGGGITYIKNLIPEWGQTARETTFYVVASHQQDGLLPQGYANIQPLVVHLPRSAAIRLLWEQIALPRVCWHTGATVMFSPVEFVPLCAPCPVVMAVRNFKIYVRLDDGAATLPSSVRRVARRLVAQASAKKAAKVIFVSEYSRSVIGPKLGLTSDRTEVIHHGVAPIFTQAVPQGSQSVDGIDRPYILTVSSISRHKNFTRLVQAYVALAQKEPECELVVTGKVEDASEYKRLAAIINEARLGSRVHLLGQVEYGRLPTLYRGASLFVFPSLLETFGHPLVEAMASGVPICCSGASSMPEICGEAASTSIRLM